MRLWMIAGLAVGVAGCGDELGIVPVTGTITLDGVPLEGAQVVFRPVEGRPSAATTDETGHYELRYTAERAGALPGDHVVQITTVRERDDGRSARELLPARYNSRSELRVSVAVDGPTCDFQLESK